MSDKAQHISCCKQSHIGNTNRALNYIILTQLKTYPPTSFMKTQHVLPGIDAKLIDAWTTGLQLHSQQLVT